MDNVTQQSLEKLLEELGKSRKNFGYPLIVAFDRKTTNHVLKQEFIEGYSGGLFIDPMNSEIVLEPGTSYHQLYDFCLDEPRLSFENADISGPKAALMMRTVRGKQLQITQPLGSNIRRVTRLAEATPISGPSLVFDIKLQDTSGEVPGDGRVYFQFTAGENHKFHGGATLNEILKLGLHFKQYFDDISDDPDKALRLEYTLGQIVGSSNSALKPQKFEIRTHGAPGSKLRNMESFGDGAVVLFIVLEGFDSEEAGPPNKNHQLPYLLPVGYSANILVNTDLLGLAIVGPALSKLPENRFRIEFKVEPGATYFYPGEGEVLFDRIHEYNGTARVSADDPRWTSPSSFNRDNAVFLEIAGNKVTIKFKAETTIIFDHYKNNERIASSTASAHWHFSQGYKFEIDNTGDQSKIKLVADEEMHTEYNATLSNELREFVVSQGMTAEQVISRIRESLASAVGQMYNFMTTLNLEIDTFVMSSLLFRRSQITLDSLHQPGDFIAPGQLAPDRNKFTISTADGTVIDQAEISVLAGGRIAFKTEPTMPNVAWSVRHLPDYTGNDLKGEINHNTAVYTAPDADKFKDSFIKVLVTAKSGENVSHVLVSVLRTTVNVYPSVMTVNLGAYGDILAGEMNKGAIGWSVEGLGKLEDIDNSDPLAQASKRYVAPTYDQIPEWEEGMPLVDSVMLLDRVKVSSGATSKFVDVLLPREIESAYWLEAKKSGEGVALEFWVKPKGQPAMQVPAEQTSWHVRVGNGTCVDGVYTPDPSKAEEYAVIVAIHDTSFVPAYASMILPLPFIEVEQFMALHAPDEAKAN